MGVRSKTLVTVILVAAVAGVYTIQSGNNPGLFKGQIFDQPEGDSTTTETPLPDLHPKLTINPPAEGENDLEANVTIENIGTGDITGGDPFRYTILINGEEVVSNTDSYSVVSAGDSFSFIYPVPRTIYQYPDQGTVTVSLDVDGSVDESNEDNNDVTVEYSL